MSEDLFLRARSAMRKCHAPYSRFPVGAALRTEDGRIYAGCNVEVVSFPEGWCAETSAIAHLVMDGGGTIAEVAVVAERLRACPPCGGCRQRLAEFARPDTRIFLCDAAEGVVETVLLEDLFPEGLSEGVAGMSEAARVIAERLGGLEPTVALVLGSGLGALVGEVEDERCIPYRDIPGFPESAVSGHAGEIVAGTLAGTPVLMLSGRIHYYEAGDPAAMRPHLEALKAFGIKTLVLTNAAGSVNPAIAPGEVMLIDDHIAFSGLNPLVGEPSDRRFLDMTTAYDERLRRIMTAAAERAGVVLHRGTYLWFSGPSFETPAEIRMARTLGADAVGMSTVPETILARFLGLEVVAASVVTNYGAGMTGAALSHEQTKAVAPAGGAKLARILKTALPKF